MVNKSTLECRNKIITKDDLNQLFNKIYDKKQELDKIYQEETVKNAAFRYEYQQWTYKNLSNIAYGEIEFEDKTAIKYDNFQNFIDVFNQRIDEIKRIKVHTNISYYYKDYIDYRNTDGYVYIYVEPDSLKCNFSIDDNESNTKGLYNYIETLFLNAPEKYDSTIKKNKLITLMSDVAINFIPSIIISIFLLFNSTIRNMASSTYVLFPICCLILVIVLSELVSLSGVKRLYNKLIPTKYAGYSNGNKIYKYDMQKMVDTCEVLIGSNVNNLEYREKIKKKYEISKKMILIELGVLLIASIIVIFL